MRRAFAVLVLVTGCGPDDVALPLAEIGKARLTVTPEEIRFAPSTWEPCHVLADGAVLTFDGTTAELADPGGSESSARWNYNHDSDAVERKTSTSCTPSVWTVPGVWTVPAPAYGDLTVELTDASATFRARWAAVHEPVVVTRTSDAIVDGRRVQTYRATPATHVYSKPMVVTKLPDGRDSMTYDFETERDGDTLTVTFPPTSQAGLGPYFLEMSWHPGNLECTGFTACSIEDPRWDREIPLD